LNWWIFEEVSLEYLLWAMWNRDPMLSYIYQNSILYSPYTTYIKFINLLIICESILNYFLIKFSQTGVTCLNYHLKISVKMDMIPNGNELGMLNRYWIHKTRATVENRSFNNLHTSIKY
jgi:hypothetical protein